jgi:hypothetical protein
VIDDAIKTTGNASGDWAAGVGQAQLRRRPSSDGAGDARDATAAAVRQKAGSGAWTLPRVGR